MKRIVLAVLLLLVASAVSAQWVQIVVDGRFVRYADPTTIRRAGDTVRMWVLTDYNAAQVTANSELSFSSKERDEFDCKDERSRLLEFTLYSGKMGAGDVVYAYSGKPRDWAPITAGSVEENLLQFACGKK